MAGMTRRGGIRRWLSAIAAGVGLLGLSSALSQDASDDITTNFSMDYYDVTATTWQDLLAAIYANRIPIAGTNEKFEGVTHYDGALEPKASVLSGQCSSENVSLSIQMTIKVPRLTAESPLSAPDLECWAAYDRKLTEHEEWHARIAEKAAQDLMAELRKATGASCSSLQQLARRRFAQSQQAQDTYDRVTVHGAQQWRAFGLTDIPDSDVSKAVIRRCSHQAS